MNKSSRSTKELHDKQQAQRSSVSSIEARRILAVLDDCKNRIDYALVLPTLNDFLEGRDKVNEDIMAAFDDFQNHQHALSIMMDSNGKPKPGREPDFEEEVGLYKDSSRDLVRVMMKHSDFFAPLLSQTSSSGGTTVRLTNIMRELNDMMLLTFSTPVESDQKQKSVIAEIKERKKSNKEYLEMLKQKETAVAREKEQKIRAKEDQLDEIKQLLTQARSTEAALQTEEQLPENDLTQEESLKAQLGETRTEVANAQKKDSDEEGKTRRLLRKEEEALQALIRQYDHDMNSLTKQNAEAKVLAEKLEKELSELQTEYNEIEKVRNPIVQEEQGFIEKTLQANKLNQDMIAAATKLQIEIRRYLKTAPKPSRRKGKGKKGKK